MSQSITYGGVDIAGHIKLPDGITGMTSHADGTYGAGSALIDDGAGIFNLVSLQEFIHEEDACSQPRTFTGFLVQRRLSRGVQVPGSGRDHDLDIVDLNYLLHLQPLRGATAKRPVETGDDRMDWLMASVALDGIVFDNGLIGSNTNLFDEADYTLQYADDVLQDLSVSSSAEVGRIFFVYRDSTSGEPSLFMDRPTVTSYTSTLSISNDLSDLSDTCFPPYMDAELQSSGEDIYCSVFFKYKTGTVFRHNDTTHATYFASKGYHRQGVFETTRVGSEATAIRHADAWLANHSGDLDTITCQIQLPADKVNLIEAGMRVQCKFTHFPGYDSFGYLRVSSRTVGLEPVNDLYLVRLELSNRTLTPGGTGGGSTGDFPHPSKGPLAVVQYAQNSATANYVTGGSISATFANPVTAGNLIIAYTNLSDSPVNPTVYDSGFTEIVEANTGKPLGWSGPGMSVAAKVADGGETTITVSVASNTQDRGVIQIVELSGATLDQHAVNYEAGTSIDVPDVTPAQGVNVLLLAWLDAFQAQSQTGDPSGYTQLQEAAPNTGSNSNRSTMYSRLVNPSSGTYGGTATYAAGVSSTGLQLSFTGADSNPPTSGEWVRGEVVGTGDGSTTTFSTDFAFADGSLVVYVDRLDQTAAVTSYDGAAGTFTLGFAPTAGELIEVDYQGR